jgi:hypothetical protein
MTPNFNPLVKDTVFDIVDILNKTLSAINEIDSYFFVNNTTGLKLSELYAMISLYRSKELADYSKILIVPDDRISDAKNDLIKIKELLKGNGIRYRDHIDILSQIIRDTYVRFEIKSIQDNLNKSDNVENKTSFLQNQLVFFLSKSATSNYSFYNQIVSHIKELLSIKQHHSYDISLRTLMSEYLTLKNSEKELVDSKDLLSAFISGDKRLIEERLNSMLKLPSYYEINKNEPENNYHAFLLGFLSSELKLYHVTSNQNTYKGRYDIALEPISNKDLFCYIIEIKSSGTTNAEEALAQIKEMDYESSFQLKGFEKFIHIGICFSGRNFNIEIS